MYRLDNPSVSSSRNIIVEHRRQIAQAAHDAGHHAKAETAPANDSELGKIGLPHLVRPRSLGMEVIGSLDHDIGRAGN